MNTSKYLLDLHRLQHTFRSSWQAFLKDFNFAVAYWDDIIIFSTTAAECLSYSKQVFEKLWQCTALNVVQQMPFIYKRNTVFGTHPQYQGHLTITFKKHKPSRTSHPPKISRHVHAFLGLVGYYRVFMKNFAKISKPLTLLTCQQVRIDWTPTHHNTFLTLKESIIQVPILWIPRSQQMIHSIYWHIRWCLQCTVIQGHWWYRIPYCLSFPYLFRNTKKIEHRGTRSLWSLLYHCQMELLSPGSRYYSTKWSQTTKQIP